MTISIYAPWADSLFETWGEDPVSQRITEQTGISFTCVAPVTDDDTKLALLISSDDLTDVIVSGWSDKNWSAMLQQGMLSDLEEVADQYAPRLFSELIDPELQDYIRQDDGTIRFLLGHWRSTADMQWWLDHDALIQSNQNVILMRQDYFDEIGDPDITSPEEFMEACEQIKENHPDKVAFYTGGVTKSGPGSLLTLFGIGSYYVAEDGTVSKSYRDPEYLNMYKWINEMTRKGLMDEESFVDSSTEKDAKSLSGEVASYVWTVGEANKVPADNEDTFYYPMQPWDCYKQIRSNTGWLRSAISAKSEHKDTAIRWMEFGNTKIGAQTMCWGIEGMRAVSDYVHSRGLKFGMYSCAGVRTCANFPGSFEHEYLDAETFAEFGCDYLKYDYCFKPTNFDGELLYRRMGLALRSCGRDIVFSMCNWGRDDVWSWARSAGAHLYRSTGDIEDSFESFRDIVLSQLPKLGSSASGCWNDIDMLTCGMYGKDNVATEKGCTDTEYATEFALWCMLGVPLMLGCDLRTMSDATRKLVLNPELIKIDQDPDCRPPQCLPWGSDMKRFVLFRLLADGDYAIGFFNMGERDGGVPVYLEQLGIPLYSGYGL